MTAAVETKLKKAKKPKTHAISDDDKELLIGAVERAPCLWQTKCPDYRDKQRRINTWWAINVELQGEDDSKWKYDAKCEWDRLRECFSNTKRRHKTKSGQAATKEPTWKFFELMLFLNNANAEAETVFESYIDELAVGADAMDQTGHNENEDPEMNPIDVHSVISDDGSQIFRPTQLNNDDGGSVFSGFVSESRTATPNLIPMPQFSAPKEPNRAVSSSSTTAPLRPASPCSSTSTLVGPRSSTSTLVGPRSSTSTVAEPRSTVVPGSSAATPTGPGRSPSTPLGPRSSASTPVGPKRPRVVSSARKMQPSESAADAQSMELRKEILATVKDLKNSSEEDAFAFFIGQQLKALPPLQKQDVMKEISDLMHKVRVRVLGRTVE